MTFVFYPINTPQPTGFIQDTDVIYVPVNKDGTVTKTVTVSKDDLMYVLLDQSPMDKLIKSFRAPNRLGGSQLRRNW